MRKYGWKPSKPDHRDRIYNLEEKILRDYQLPASVDLKAQMPPIWDQGQLGSCTAHGNLRAYIATSLKQGEPYEMLSRLFLYYEERKAQGTIATDSGAEVRDGIKVLASEGCPPETDWPYDITKFADTPPAQAYTDASSHEAIQYRSIQLPSAGCPMRTALANRLPIVFGFSVPQYFEDPSSWDPTKQILRLPSFTDQIIGGHCVVVTGYDWTGKTPYFWIDNSWGPDWGIEGRFKMDYRWFNNQLATDLWVIERTS